MKISRLAVPAMLVAALFLGACSSDSKKSDTKNTTTTTSPATKSGSMGVMNSKCPMTGEEVDSTSPTMDYKSGKVAFCCPGCEGKFSKLSDADKAAKVTAAK